MPSQEELGGMGHAKIKPIVTRLTARETAVRFGRWSDGLMTADRCQTRSPARVVPGLFGQSGHAPGLPLCQQRS